MNACFFYFFIPFRSGALIKSFCAVCMPQLLIFSFRCSDFDDCNANYHRWEPSSNRIIVNATNDIIDFYCIWNSPIFLFLICWLISFISIDKINQRKKPQWHFYGDNLKCDVTELNKFKFFFILLSDWTFFSAIFNGRLIKIEINNKASITRSSWIDWGTLLWYL